jgi:hypothetical protein
MLSLIDSLETLWPVLRTCQRTSVPLIWSGWLHTYKSGATDLTTATLRTRCNRRAMF